MYKFNLEDPTGELEVVVFPREAKNYSEDFFKEGEIAYITGTVNKETDDENSTYKIFLTSVEKVDTSTIYSGQSLYLDAQSISEKDLNIIYDIIKNHNGNKQVFLVQENDNGKFYYKFNKTTNKKAERQILEIIKKESHAS